jgi:hypothetical protein
MRTPSHYMTHRDAPIEGLTLHLSWADATTPPVQMTKPSPECTRNGHLRGQLALTTTTAVEIHEQESSPFKKTLHAMCTLDASLTPSPTHPLSPTPASTPPRPHPLTLQSWLRGYTAAPVRAPAPVVMAAPERETLAGPLHSWPTSGGPQWQGIPAGSQRQACQSVFQRQAQCTSESTAPGQQQDR